MTRDQQVAALRRWPKVLARSFIGKHAPEVRPIEEAVEHLARYRRARR